MKMENEITAHREGRLDSAEPPSPEKVREMLTISLGEKALPPADRHDLAMRLSTTTAGAAARAILVRKRS